jgi:hypothetical protein
MKYQIAWNSPIQGAQSTTVDAINTFAAREQFESMYGNIDGLNVISISPVFDREESPQPQESYGSNESSSSSSSYDYDLSSSVGTLAIVAGVIIAFLGFFALPAGIVAMVIGGAVGWLGWKLACWLADRGW